MFDLAWSEIAVIGIVALIAIGPKDLPVAIRAVSEMMKKARRMASEFQGHVDEMVRESNLHEVRDQINDIRNMDIKGRILDAVDSDGALQRTIAGGVGTPHTPPAPEPLPEVGVAAHEPHVIAAPEPVAVPDVPAMIPPSVAAPVAAPAMIPPADAARAAAH